MESWTSRLTAAAIAKSPAFFMDCGRMTRQLMIGAAGRRMPPALKHDPPVNASICAGPPGSGKRVRGPLSLDPARCYGTIWGKLIAAFAAARIPVPLRQTL
jgi:hypothetical protein